MIFSSSFPFKILKVFGCKASGDQISLIQEIILGKECESGTSLQNWNLVSKIVNNPHSSQIGRASGRVGDWS